MKTFKQYLTNNYGKVVLFTNEKEYDESVKKVKTFRPSTQEEIKADQKTTVARVSEQTEKKKNFTDSVNKPL